MLSVRRRLRIIEAAEEWWKKQKCTSSIGARLHQSSRIENLQFDPKAIVIGSYSHIRGQLTVMPHGGRISIGNYCFVGEGARIWSSQSIAIGDHVLISYGVSIHDNISHPRSARRRHEHFQEIATTGYPKQVEDIPSAEIVIEDDVWIGFNSTVMKGVTIGRGAIIGAGSMVVEDVEAYTTVVGNPARVVGRAEP